MAIKDLGQTRSQMTGTVTGVAGFPNLALKPGSTLWMPGHCRGGPGLKNPRWGC